MTLLLSPKPQPLALCPQQPTHMLPSHANKRPRGLWKGQCRDNNSSPSKFNLLSHDRHRDHLLDDSSTSPSSSCHGGDAFDDYEDDNDDAQSSSDSSYKRRRLSDALSDTETLCHPASRSLTPDFTTTHSAAAYYHHPFPSQILTSPPYSPLKKSITIMHAGASSESINSKAKGKQPSMTDLEDWQNLKALFVRASESYDSDETCEALPLLRAVIRECHRFMREHPDPSLVYADSRSRPSTALAPSTTKEQPPRDWTLAPPGLPTNLPRSTEPPTAFHTIFGTALMYMGSLIAQDPSSALPDEPATPPTYWLAALDVFETGENLQSALGSSGGGLVKQTHKEDWRLAVSWGRALVLLSEEKIDSTPSVKKAIGGGLLFGVVEPRWPPTSPFHAIASSRPPVTRRMSLAGASAHDVMVLAMDQFSRGIFHMPHPSYQYPAATAADDWENEDAVFSHSHSQMPGVRENEERFSRPKELFTIGSDVLGVAERMEKAAQREYWAVQADSVFNQMKMEAAHMGEWRMAVNMARGRCWLVVGEARAEEMERRLEDGDESVLRGTEAEEARESLAMAVTFFERAKGSATAKPNPELDVLSPLLAEALLTLANLTVDENTREELYARAQVEGGDTIELQLDPPPMKFPAAISAIAIAVNKQQSLPALEIVVESSAGSVSVEASPAVVLAAGRAKRSENVSGFDQEMLS
ncbi:hypothetical protein BC835DRAFT_1400880 [Cytidiella melzeri]|nr:hypothetical protein BC835DRAFT_1400880 [Cytidiella melzeri]